MLTKAERAASILDIYEAARRRRAKMHPKRSVAVSEAGSPKLGRRATSLRHYRDRLIPRQFEGLETDLDHEIDEESSSLGRGRSPGSLRGGRRGHAIDAR